MYVNILIKKGVCMDASYFKNKQSDIIKYKNYLQERNIVIDKTNKEFLELILNILTYLATQDPQKLDEECEYNIMTMKEEFEGVIYSTNIDEKAQATLLIFFLRIAEEMFIKYKTIENEHLNKLHYMMTSKNYKYPSYINEQKAFALEYMPENIQRMLRLK